MRRRRTLAAAAGLLAAVAASPEAPAFELRLRQELVLPSAAEFHQPESLSVLAGGEVALVVAAHRGAAAAVVWTVWRVDGDRVRRILPELGGEILEGCVPRGEDEALCLLLAPRGELRTGVLDLGADRLGERKRVGVATMDAVRGMAPSDDGGLVVWGMSLQRPFAMRLDQEGDPEWTVRREEVGRGEFVDARVAPEAVTLLARSRTGAGLPGDVLAVVQVGAAGTVVGSERRRAPSASSLPVLREPEADAAAEAAGAARSGAAELGIATLEVGVTAQLGLVEPARLDPDTVAYLATEGTGAILVVDRGAGAEMARAPVAGLPFSGRVAGRGRTVYVLTTDVDRAQPSRQVLRLTRFELDE